jgi:hypothetical protein
VIVTVAVAFCCCRVCCRYISFLDPPILAANISCTIGLIYLTIYLTPSTSHDLPHAIYLFHADEPC